MLEFTGINYWAVTVVWLVYIAVGAWWYSPAGFAKRWKTYTGIDLLKLPKKDVNQAIVSVIVSSLLQSFALAVILNSVGVKSVTEGLSVGLLIWFAFTTASTVGVTLYSKRSWKFLWLNSAYFFVVMTIASIILTVWK
ncbi:MAG: DUF1761 domain-containing protein [Candidatus Microsaccharimonas sp.]